MVRNVLLFTWLRWSAMNFRWIHRSSSARQRRLIEQFGCLQVETRSSWSTTFWNGECRRRLCHQPSLVRDPAEIAADSAHPDPDDHESRLAI
jgi:hypothetical protein